MKTTSAILTPLLMALLLSPFDAFTTISQPVAPVVDQSTLTRMRGELVALIENDNELIPNWVQFVFHSCVGDCNGCINITDPDNKVLLETYYYLRELHSSNYTDVITLADFVVVTGTVAAEYGMRVDGSQVPDIPIKFGRQTCDNPSNPHKVAHLPDGNNPSAFQDLITEFHLTQHDAVALIGGGHSLGKARRCNSGFHGQWDFTPTKLNNGFFVSLLLTNWTRTEIDTGKFQWNSTDIRMMLPSDIQLARDIARNDTCLYSKTCPMSDMFTQSQSYISNQTQLHRDFVVAFSKMVENTDQLLQQPANRT